MARPVMTRITLQPSVLAKITPLARARSGRMFAPVLFDKIRSTIENRMRRVMAEVEKKRPTMILLNERHRFVV